MAKLDILFGISNNEEDDIEEKILTNNEAESNFYFIGIQKMEIDIYFHIS